MTPALIDTGSLVVPVSGPAGIWIGLSDGRSSIELGDGSIVPGTPVYLGTLEIAGLFSFRIRIRITVMGNEYNFGRSYPRPFRDSLRSRPEDNCQTLRLFPAKKPGNKRYFRRLKHMVLIGHRLILG